MQQVRSTRENASAHPSGDPPASLAAMYRCVAGIPGERLVATVTRQGNGDSVTGHTRDEKRRHRRGVAERLAVVPHELREDLPRVRLHHELLVIGMVACRHLPCMDELVVSRDAEADAERLDRPSRGVAHHRDHQARIHAARTERPQRHVGNHASLYRSPKRDLTSLEPLLLVTDLAACIVERPVTTGPDSLRSHLHEARCRKLLDFPVDASVLCDEVEIEELVDRTGIDCEAIAGGEPDTLDVAREVEPVAKIRIEERFLPQPVSRKEQALARSIPESEREHPVQALEEPLRSPFLVRMNDDLGVGPRSEAMSGSPELVSQVIEVVDLAVEDDPDRPVLVAHGLVAGRRAVDDAEPSVGKPDARRQPETAIVGTTCQHYIAH